MFSFIQNLFKPKQQNSFDDIRTITPHNKTNFTNINISNIKKKKTIHFKLKANPLEVHNISQYK